jgi:hypothetical protein
LEAEVAVPLCSLSSFEGKEGRKREGNIHLMEAIIELPDYSVCLTRS